MKRSPSHSSQGTDTSGERVPEFLSTQPYPQGRIKELQSRMPSMLNTCQQVRNAGRRPDCS